VRVRPDDDLVAAVLPGLPEREAKREAGIALDHAAGVQRLLGAVEQPRDVDPHQRSGDEPERRQRRVAAADRRLPGDDAHTALFRQLFQRRARVCDRDEAIPVLAAFLPEQVELAAGLEGAPRLRGDDEQRPAEVEGVGQPP
jgi:hypothetical protein